MDVQVFEQDLLALICSVLRCAGVEERTAKAVAHAITAAERDGSHSHGLMRIPGYLGSISSGWVNGRAEMTVVDQAPGVVHVDANNGFAQGALARGRSLLAEKARTQGIASLVVQNSHHFGCLWADVEPFADEGLVAMSFINSRSRIVGPGARKKVLGTNPMAFAAPRASGPPLVWDQASSVMAHGDVLIAAREGRPLPPNCGVDRDGAPTQDAQAVADGGALLPFAGHKGMLIALLVEILAAGISGSRFGFEDESARFPGAQTSNAGQLVIVMDPARMGAAHFATRVDALLNVLVDAGTERLPGQRRFEQRRRAQESGISISKEFHIELMKMAGLAQG